VLVAVAVVVVLVVLELAVVEEAVALVTELRDVEDTVTDVKVEVLVSDAVLVVFCAQNVPWSPVYSRQVRSQMCEAEQVGQNAE
jgi:hypothetical protein